MICDACLRPTKAHLPSDLEICATYEPWSCAGCGEKLPLLHPVGEELCATCREMRDAYDTKCGGMVAR